MTVSCRVGAAYHNSRRACVVATSAYRIASSGSGATFGAWRRNFISRSPVDLPARFLKNSAAVSTTPTFSATATAIHWFSETPSSFAKRWAAFLMDTGSFNGYVALLISHLLQQFGWAQYCDVESASSQRKITDIVGDQSICLAVDGSFQDHLIVWVPR